MSLPTTCSIDGCAGRIVVRVEGNHLRPWAAFCRAHAHMAEQEAGANRFILHLAAPRERVRAVARPRVRSLEQLPESTDE